MGLIYICLHFNCQISRQPCHSLKIQSVILRVPVEHTLVHTYKHGHPLDVGSILKI